MSILDLADVFMETSIFFALISMIYGRTEKSIPKKSIWNLKCFFLLLIVVIYFQLRLPYLHGNANSVWHEILGIDAFCSQGFSYEVRLIS